MSKWYNLYYKKFNAFEVEIKSKNNEQVYANINITCPHMIDRTDKLSIGISTLQKYYDIIIEKYGKSERSIGIFIWTKFEGDCAEIEKQLFDFYKIKGWTIIKALTKVLSLHKHAVITANHPDRLLQQGYFQLEI